MNNKIENMFAFSLIGVAAYFTTDIIHEVLGHSFVTLMLGHKITLLSSVYFRSIPRSNISSISGPISNLLFGLLILFIPGRKNNLSVISSLLLFLIMSYNFYWFSGTLLQSCLSSSGDWTYSIQQYNIGIFGNILLIMLSIIAYYFSIKFCRAQVKEINIKFSDFPLRQFIYYSYLGAAVSAIIAGLFFVPDRLTAAKEGLYEMLASIPIIFIASYYKSETINYSFKSSPTIFSITVFLLFLLFCFTLGNGFILQ